MDNSLKFWNNVKHKNVSPLLLVTHNQYSRHLSHSPWSSYITQQLYRFQRELFKMSDLFEIHNPSVKVFLKVFHKGCMGVCISSRVAWVLYLLELFLFICWVAHIMSVNGWVTEVLLDGKLWNDKFRGGKKPQLTSLHFYNQTHRSILVHNIMSRPNLAINKWSLWML